MAKIDLKEYLKQVVNLESFLYSQTAIYEKAERELRPFVPSQPKVQAPRKPTPIVNKPDMPHPKYDEGDKVLSRKLLLISISTGMLGGGCFGYGLVEEFLGYAIFLLVLCAGFFAGWVALRLAMKRNYDQAMSQYVKETERYRKDQAAAEEAYPKAMKAYEIAMKVYQEEVKSAERKYKRETKNAEQNYENGKKALCQIKDELSETKRVLEQLYALDIVFPKYRNFVAMCTIYEYIVSGRCAELEGPNGAYNLYEAELRQNLIINQLDRINRNLEAIKANQYMLYKEMSKANATLNKISNDISEVRKTTQIIKEFSAVTAHCASITAANTEALKYLALVK